MSALRGLAARDRALLIVFISMSLVGSLLSVVIPAGCGGCDHAKQALGYLPLGYVGVALYGGLLVALIYRHGISTAERLIVLAAGVHMALFAILIWKHAMCWICVGTGSGALLATGCLLFRSLIPPRTALIVGLVGTVVIGGPMVQYARYLAHAGERRALAAAENTVHGWVEPRTADVDLIILTRAGCERCAAFKSNILPILLENPAIHLTERRADDDVPTPVVMALGKKTYMTFGLQPLTTYQQMLDAAKSGSPSPLPKVVALISDGR